MASDTTCTVTFEDGTPCTRTLYTTDWCHPCYAWSWRNGGKDPNGRRPRRVQGQLDAELRAAAFATTDECIYLSGYTNRPSVGNAGRFDTDAKGMNASRAVWWIAKGDPGDKFVCHTCNGGSGASGCINIRHLYLGDEVENKRDMVTSGHTLRGVTHNQGEGNGNAILTEEAVRDIRSAYARGRKGRPGNAAALAEKYGVTIDTIRDVAARRAWKHV